MLGNFLDFNTLTAVKSFSIISKFFVYNEYSNIATLKKNLYFNFHNLKNKYIFINLLNILSTKLLKNLLIINCNLRYEIPFINYKLREYSLKENCIIAYMNDIKNLTINFKFIHLTPNNYTLNQFIGGKNWFCINLINSFFSSNLIFTKILINQIIFGISFFLNNKFKFVKFFDNLILSNLNNLNYNVYTGLKLFQPTITLVNSTFQNLNFVYCNILSLLKPNKDFWFNSEN